MIDPPLLLTHHFLLKHTKTYLASLVEIKGSRRKGDCIRGRMDGWTDIR